MTIARFLMSAAVAGSLVVAPAAAAPAEVENARVSSELEGEDLRAGGAVLPIAFLVAIIVAVLLVTGGEEVPQSPG